MSCFLTDSPQKADVFVYQQQEQDTTNLYIANLPPCITETDLERMFQPYGSVISTRILRDNNGMSRGVGFARMESKEKCELVIQAFNGKYLPGVLAYSVESTVLESTLWYWGVLWECMYSLKSTLGVHVLYGIGST